MRSGFWFVLLLVLAVPGANAFGQTGSVDPAPGIEKKPHSEITDPGHDHLAVDPGVPANEGGVSSAASTSVSISLPRRDRFKAFLNDSFGPDTLLFEAAAAGVTSGRNAPKEWGGKVDGFARRYGSNLGKNLIRQSVTYGLDEALKVDSTFYRSRDRGIAARFRNSVFSAVTARDRRGKRVISIPKIAGSLTGNIAASQLWYPDRYNYVHGLKGASITLAFDVAHNLLREFVWKK